MFEHHTGRIIRCWERALLTVPWDCSNSCQYCCLLNDSDTNNAIFLFYFSVPKRTFSIVRMFFLKMLNLKKKHYKIFIEYMVALCLRNGLLKQSGSVQSCGDSWTRGTKIILFCQHCALEQGNLITTCMKWTWNECTKNYFV